MVYTITLNPALDRTMWVQKIHPDDSNRIKKEERYAGGKGIDVSKVLTTLQVRSNALGFVGFFAGEEMEGRLLNEGINCDFTRISGETRTNIIVNDMSNRKQTVFSASGPEIKPYELMQIIHKVEKLEKPDMIVLSGSLQADSKGKSAYSVKGTVNFYKGSYKYSKIRVLKSIEFAEEIAKYILNTFK